MNPIAQEEADIEAAVIAQLRRQPLHMLETVRDLPDSQKQIAAAFERLDATGIIETPIGHREGRYQLAT
jgi:hypothetical protein